VARGVQKVLQDYKNLQVGLLLLLLLHAAAGD
jgi:hypothetical protein